ncbi:baeRF7 domain-containing protein [Spirosoma pollinicola]|nr:hypothetical protein [Spirosoma pollinicola]
MMTDQQPNGINLEHVDKDILLDLAMQTHAQSISLFIPTHQRGKEVNEGQDILAFKNHIQRIRQTLEAQSLRSNEITSLMHPLEALLNDTQFWRHQQQGLAVFRNSDFFAIFHSPIPLENSSWLDAKFHLQPLLPFAQRSPVYCLLQISKKGVSLFKADTYTIAPLDLAGSMPSGLEDVTNYYDFDEEVQGRTNGRNGAMAMYASNEDTDTKEKDHLLADYFRLINAAIIEMMGTQNLPLVLASVAYFQPIYHNINTYPNLHKEGLTGNFDHSQPEELHQMAQKLLGDSIDQTKRRFINQYQNSNGSEMVSSDARALLKAGVIGCIDALFLKTETSLWGYFDEITLKTTIHDNRQDGDESLVEKIALLTLLHGGKLYVMDEVNLLENQEPVNMAALFRF